MNAVYSRVERSPKHHVGLRPAIFLDRDGVIIEDTHYLHRPEDVQFIPGALQAIADLNKLNFSVVLVTNQSGIGRGYYTWSDFEAVQEYILRELTSFGGWFDGVWACAFAPDGNSLDPASYHRKPGPGMLLAAAQALGLDLLSSWLVGDKPSDIEAAIAAGLTRSVHVLTGHGRDTRDVVRLLIAERRPACEIHFCESIVGLRPLLPTAASSALPITIAPRTNQGRPSTVNCLNAPVSKTPLPAVPIDSSNAAPCSGDTRSEQVFSILVSDPYSTTS